jgi:hypothetical protein
MYVLVGTDFFTVEVLTWRGLVTFYVLFFLHLETRRVSLAGITRHPTEEWMTQLARNAADEESGYLNGQSLRWSRGLASPQQVLSRSPSNRHGRRNQADVHLVPTPAMHVC